MQRLTFANNRHNAENDVLGLCLTDSMLSTLMTLAVFFFIKVAIVVAICEDEQRHPHIM